jgi:hypothetical protein
MLAIKQAAAAECVLVINPSRNPQANQVFATVLGPHGANVQDRRRPQR